MNLTLKDGKVVPALCKKERKLICDARQLLAMIAQLAPMEEKLANAASVAADALADFRDTHGAALFAAEENAVGESDDLK